MRRVSIETRLPPGLAARPVMLWELPVQTIVYLSLWFQYFYE